MFGEATGTTMPAPTIPRAEEWPAIYKLNREKEVVGIFISGQPPPSILQSEADLSNSKANLEGQASVEKMVFACQLKATSENLQNLAEKGVSNKSDFDKIVEIANKHNIITIVDNTVATPYLCKPIKN
jgi:hypothetical protein